MNVCIKLLWNGNIKIIHNEHFFDLLLKTLFSIPYTTLYTHYMLEFTWSLQKEIFFLLQMCLC